MGSRGVAAIGEGGSHDVRIFRGLTIRTMTGDLLQGLQRRLMNGDSEAQDLAWRLHRANDLDTMLLLEKHNDIVAQYPAQEEADDQHPTFEFDQ